MTKDQAREILLNTLVPEEIGLGMYRADAAYKFCNSDINADVLEKTGLYPSVVIEALKLADKLELSWEDFPELQGA